MTYCVRSAFRIFVHIQIELTVKSIRKNTTGKDEDRYYVWVYGTELHFAVTFSQPKNLRYFFIIFVLFNLRFFRTTNENEKINKRDDDNIVRFDSKITTQMLRGILHGIILFRMNFHCQTNRLYDTPQPQCQHPTPLILLIQS